ncbi:MAG: hypothetical protein JO016_18925 [Actinobacteria bacterium]|jgi:hypothetical protein|nr:hypothetical protein [Actinomycetota bacterium]
MRGQLIRRILAAAALGGTAVLAAAAPGQAATTTGTQAAAKAKYIQASGYTGKKVHFTWAGPSVGAIAWTVGSDFVATKTNAYRSCNSNWTGVNIDASWNSESLHNGAKIGMLISVKLSNGRSKGIVALTVSHAANWPGHPAFGGEYHANVYTPGNVHVVQGRILSWISNGGVPYGGSTDTLTLQQFRRC